MSIDIWINLTDSTSKQLKTPIMSTGQTEVRSIANFCVCAFDIEYEKFELNTETSSKAEKMMNETFYGFIRTMLMLHWIIVKTTVFQ
jgi:hypothetical protein